MEKRQRVTRHAAAAAAPPGCLCFRVTMPATTTPALARVELLLLSGVFVIFALVGSCAAVGYSYTRFEGPVVGPEQLIHVPDAYGGGTHADYVARPEYSFAYGVEDGQTRVLQNRKETRNGDEVRGVYSVVDPDGTLRVVKYTADDANGFQAEVITNGIARLHGHGSEDGAGASVDEQVQHEQGNEVNDEEEGDEGDEGEQHETPQQHEGQQEAEEEEDDEEQEQEQPHAAVQPQAKAAPKKKGHYEVHEDYDEGEEDQGGEEKEGGGDHEEYEGSSEEGYVGYDDDDDASRHRQRDDAAEEDSSEEY